MFVLKFNLPFENLWTLHFKRPAVRTVGWPTTKCATSSATIQNHGPWRGWEVLTYCDWFPTLIRPYFGRLLENLQRTTSIPFPLCTFLLIRFIPNKKFAFCWVNYVRSPDQQNLISWVTIDHVLIMIDSWGNVHFWQEYALLKRSRILF